MAAQAANTTSDHTTSVYTVEDSELEDELEFKDVVPESTQEDLIKVNNNILILNN